MLHFTSTVSNIGNKTGTATTLTATADTATADTATSNIGGAAIDDYTERLGMRRFSARSLVLSVLLGSDPPRLPVGALIDFCSLFEIAPGTVRTALSRLAAAGEVVAVDGAYVLVGDLLERRLQQEVGRVAPTTEWDGSWWTAIALAESRDVNERRRFRTAMEGAKMGELRPTAWMRPANIAPPPPRHELIVSRGELPIEDGRALVGRLWDLDVLGHRADELLSALDLDEDDLAKRFIALAACLQYLRTEPQLPRTVDPGRRADALRVRYTPEEARFQRDLRAFLRVSTAGR
jgi:phenylacetic acid degradation operon negative regulatory protein